MENELVLEESVSFINGKAREVSSRSGETKHWKWKRKYSIYVAVSCLAVTLIVLALTMMKHIHSNRIVESSIAHSSYRFCGNQSAKVCIQDSECSLSRMKRLVNGKITRKDTWPWMAEVVYNRKHYCGAVLISIDVLVTAAHCLFHHENRLYEGDIEIRIGSRRKLSIDENTQIFKVSTIHIHHSFELSSLQNDIAILRLSSPVQLSRTAWPICLSAGAQSITGSSNAIMIGWGKTSYNGYFSSLLRETSVPISPISQCIKANKDLFDGVRVSRTNNICVGYGKDRPDYGCNGDSGGPLMVQSNSNRWILVGIMSWGEPHCSAEQTNSYTVFTNISPYLNWIEGIL